MGFHAGNRLAVLDALSPLGILGNGIAGGEGAIYFWAKLPEGCCDEKVVEWLIHKYGICIIPGTACGMPGMCGCHSELIHFLYGLKGFLHGAQ